MKRLLVAVLCLFVVGSLFAFDSSELNKVTIRNKTGQRIDYLFFSPGDSVRWGCDILGSSNSLEPNASRVFWLHYPNECDNFDLMAIDSSGTGYTLRNYKVCDGQEPTIDLTSRIKMSSPPDLEYFTVELTNVIGREIFYLFLTPEDTKMLGPDMLGEEDKLMAGDTFSILVPKPSELVRYRFTCFDGDNQKYQFAIKIDPSRSSDTIALDIETSDRVR